MHRLVWAAAAGLIVAIVGVGCGRPSLPGQSFQGEKVETATSPAATSPLPEEPYLEWGSADAKVRVLAFFPIDEEHTATIELIKGLTEEHAGKVYARYVDYRTLEGSKIFERTSAGGRCVMINGELEIEIEGEEGKRYEVTFAQEVGRFWTADDLRRAVAQEVERQY